MSNLPNFPTIRPSLLLDFANSMRIDPRISFTRASTATYYDANGVLRTAASGVPRIDYDPVTGECKGLLVEEARTNSIPNNTMQGVAAGVPGTGPTGWQVAPTANGITREIVGSGTEAGISYLDIKFSGTPTTTLNAAVVFAPPTAISVSAGQTWTGTAFVRLVAGSLTNTSPTFSLLETDVGGAGVGENGVSISPTAAALALQRYALTTTVDAAGAAYLQPRIRIGYTAGAPVDLTLRIGMPQLELGAFAASVIPTTSAAATRAADAASMVGTNFSEWFNPLEGMLYAEASSAGSDSADEILAICDGTNSNRIVLRRDGANTRAAALVVTSGTTVANLTGSVGQYLPNTAGKLAVAYAADNFAFSFNGAAVLTDTAGALPVGVTMLRIGAGGDGNLLLNGHIRRIAYYPKRLANAELQALTA